MIAKEKKQAIINEYGRTPNDTGSPEVKVRGFYFKTDSPPCKSKGRNSVFAFLKMESEIRVAGENLWKMTEDRPYFS